MEHENRKLYRLPQQGMIAGVAAGFADYFNMDVTVMRLLFVIAAVLTGGGAVIAYVIVALVMPTPDTIKETSAIDDTPNAAASKTPSSLTQYLGVALVVAGAWMLLSILMPQWLAVQWRLLWPVLLIGLGILIVVRSRK